MMQTNDPSFRFKLFFWGGQIVLFGGIIGSLALYVFRHGQHPLPQYTQVPEFTLTECSGKKISLADLRGQVWVADFIFTRCAGPCPLITGRMKQIQAQVSSADDVTLVSFSVDPEHDTPQVLSEYAVSVIAVEDMPVTTFELASSMLTEGWVESAVPATPVLEGWVVKTSFAAAPGFTVTLALPETPTAEIVAPTDTVPALTPVKVTV